MAFLYARSHPTVALESTLASAVRLSNTTHAGRENPFKDNTSGGLGGQV